MKTGVQINQIQLESEVIKMKISSSWGYIIVQLFDKFIVFDINLRKINQFSLNQETQNWFLFSNSYDQDFFLYQNSSEEIIYFPLYSLFLNEDWNQKKKFLIKVTGHLQAIDFISEFNTFFLFYGNLFSLILPHDFSKE